MTTTSQINITAKDSTAAAFASAQGNLTALSSSAVRAAASIAGVTLSFAGLASSIKSSIDAADATFKLSQKIGVAVEQLAGLELAFKQSGLGAEQLQSSISKLSKNVASGNSAFAAMGIATKDADGNLKSTRQILAEVSDKFASYQDGISKTALAIQIFGKSGADVIPLLNQGSESLAQFDAMAEKLGLTLSQSTAKKAEEFNDTLSLVGQSFRGVSTRIAAEMLPTLQGLAEQFFNTATQGNNIKVVSDGISTALKGLVGVALGAAGAFKTVGTTLGGVAAMWGAIASGEFAQASTIVKQIKADFSENFTATINSVTNAWKANGSASVEALAATQKQVQIQAPLTSEIEKSTKSIEKQSKALNFQVGNLKELQEIYSKVQSITRGVETDQEKYNRTIEELNELKPYLGAETYARALQKAQTELKGTVKETRVTTNEIDQLWTQAGRNIQSSLANSIFNFFDDGLSGMVKNVGIAVARIASEFAALKLAQGLGIGAIFGGASSAAMAGGGGGGSILGSAMSLGSNALGLVNSGFGAASLIGGGLSSLGGSIGAFGSGLAGTSAGVFSAAGGAGTAFIGGAGTAIGGTGMGAAASLGAGMAAAATIALPLVAADIVGRLLAGDKKLGGAEMIPVLGGFLAALFGRGPYKFRQQSLQGEVSSEGFDGDIANVFRSKGGLFSKNKHKTVIEELSADQQLAFDTAITGFYDSAHRFAENLGLPTELVDNFTTQIQIKSNKGGKLKEEVITEMLSGIADSLAKSVLPSIADLAKVGERAFETFTRLNTEFSGLAAGAVNLGASIEKAKELIKGMSFSARDDLIAMAGGLENLASLTSYFNQNFLTQQEQLAPVVEGLTSGLEKLGIASDITKEQFKAMVQDVNLSNATRIELLRLAPALLSVRNASAQASAATSQAAAAVETYTSVVNVRNVNDTEQGQRLNASINETAQAIAELEGIASQLSGTVNSINPLSTNQARRIVASGNPYDPNLQNALSVLSTSDANDFGSKLDMQRSKALNIGAINSLQNSVASNISAKEAQQAQYEFEKQMLQISLQNAAVMYSTLEQAAKTAEILDKATAGGGAMLVEVV